MTQPAEITYRLATMISRCRIPLRIPLCLAVGIAGCWYSLRATAQPVPDRHPGLVLLENGHVFRGELTLSGDDYQILSPKGDRLTIPRRDVAFVGANLQAVYQFQARAINLSSPTEHVELAHWCLREGMADAARQHISLALALDPHDPRIRSLNDTVATLGTMSPTPSKAVPPTPEALDHLPRMDEAPPADVSPEARKTFVRQIQPLLLLRCSGCHTPTSAREFVLQRLPGNRTVPPRVSQRNLVAVLDQTATETLRRRFAERAGDAHVGATPLTRHEMSERLTPWLVLRAKSDPGTKSADPRSPAMRADPDPLPREAEGPGPADPPKEPRPISDPFDPELFNRGLAKPADS